MRILVAESDSESARLIVKTLTQGGHSVALARDGAEALEAIGREPFDALLTSLVMPSLGGADLVRKVRARATPAPLVMIITAPDSAEARTRALDSGADDYLAKPHSDRDLLALLSNCLARRHQPAPQRSRPALATPLARPPFVGVALAASAGGPDAVSKILRALPAASPAAYFMVLHGPVWMLETFVLRVRANTSLRLKLAADGARAAPGEGYLAPGDRHLCVEPGSLTLRLTTDPPENFVRPAADPLFRSMARAFGRHCVAVILSGMGRDGSVGAEHVAAAGGVVLAQDPATTVAPSMPQTLINMGIATEVVPIAEIPAAVTRHVEALTADLRRGRQP